MSTRLVQFNTVKSVKSATSACLKGGNFSIVGHFHCESLMFRARMARVPDGLDGVDGLDSGHRSVPSYTKIPKQKCTRQANIALLWFLIFVFVVGVVSRDKSIFDHVVESIKTNLASSTNVVFVDDVTIKDQPDGSTTNVLNLNFNVPTTTEAVSLFPMCVNPAWDRLPSSDIHWAQPSEGVLLSIWRGMARITFGKRLPSNHVFNDLSARTADIRHDVLNFGASSSVHTIVPAIDSNSPDSEPGSLTKDKLTSHSFGLERSGIGCTLSISGVVGRNFKRTNRETPLDSSLAAQDSGGSPKCDSEYRDKKCRESDNPVRVYRWCGSPPNQKKLSLTELAACGFVGGLLAYATLYYWKKKIKWYEKREDEYISKILD